MAAVVADMFETAGSALAFLTALVILVTLLVRMNKVRGEVIQVKASTNGRLDRLLEENRRLREHLIATGIDPESVLKNVSP